MGQTFGHEFVGVIEEIGAEVQRVKVGDRVIVPFADAGATLIPGDIDDGYHIFSSKLDNCIKPMVIPPRAYS